MYTFKVFSAAWCPNCTVLKASLDEHGVRYETVDCDSPEGMQEAANLGIRGLPTTVVSHNDIVVRTIVGLQPIREYKKYDGVVDVPVINEGPSVTADTCLNG